MIGKIRLNMMGCDIVVVSEGLAKEFGEISNQHLPIDMMDKDITKSTSKYLPERLKYRLSLEKQRLQRRFETKTQIETPSLNKEVETTINDMGKEITWRIQSL